ncbi:MAG TPA: cyclic nucleotide-binding domain-containing protein [Polyangiaceae bacterium]|nr:cyclic nucleotide-binding domain-containing protein [Polyangiaceae bacterium]
MPDSAEIVASDLRNIGLFGALSDEVLAFLASMLTVVKPTIGETIFREGDEANAMYVVLAGEMEVTKKSRGAVDARVAVLGPGDWFGEMSIVDIQPRSATVRALAPGRLIRISAGDLDALYRHDVRSYAIIVLNLARELSRRLRVADGILADLIANVMDSYLAKRPSAG